MKQRPAFVYWLDMRKYGEFPLEYDKEILLAAIERYLVKSYCLNIKPSYNPSCYTHYRNVDMLYDAFMGESPFTHSSVEVLSKAMLYNDSALSLSLMAGPCIIIK